MDLKDEKAIESPEEQKDQPQNPSTNTITLGVDEFKDFIKATVESVINSSKTSEVREEIETYNKKISEAVQNNNSSLLRPVKAESQSNLEYVEKVLSDDERERRRNPDGKAYYGETPEDFTKAKIIILKKIGLTNEEIAKVFEN